MFWVHLTFERYEHAMVFYKFIFIFLLRTNIEKRYLNESNFHHYYGNFIEAAILKVIDHNYVQSSFLTITKHIDNSILKDTLQFRILRSWIKIRANSFIKIWVHTWNENYLKRCLENYHLQKNTNPHQKERCTKLDDFLRIFIRFFFSLSNLVSATVKLHFCFLITIDILQFFNFIQCFYFFFMKTSKILIRFSEDFHPQNFLIMFHFPWNILTG